MRLLSRDSLQVFVIQYHDAARSCVGRLKYGQARDQSSKASYPGKDKRVAYADTPGYTPTPRTPAASMSVLGLERHLDNRSCDSLSSKSRKKRPA